MRLPNYRINFPPSPQLQRSGISVPSAGDPIVDPEIYDDNGATIDAGIYSSLTYSGSTIEFSGNGFSRNPNNMGIIYYDTGVQFATGGTTEANFLKFGLLLEFVPTSGVDDLNIGIFCFTANPRTSAGTDGAGWIGAGCISKTGEPANSCMLYQVGNKRTTGFQEFRTGNIFSPPYVASSIRRLFLQGSFAYRTFTNSSSTFTNLPDYVSRGNCCFGDTTTTWFEASPSNNVGIALTPTGVGGNIFVGILLGRDVGTTVPTAVLDNVSLKFLGIKG